MEHFQLIFDKKIQVLERSNRWKAAVDIVFQQWVNNPNNLNCLLCAGTQLWYTLLTLDEIKNDYILDNDVELVSTEQLETNLMRVTQYGLQNFSNNSVFNAYFGYMISVTPGFFLRGEGDYLSWEKRGIEMIRRSFAQNPENLLAQAFYYELDGIGRDTTFYQACAKIWSRITSEQWGDSEVQQYFFRILHGDSF